MPKHTDKQYEEELRFLKEEILKAGAVVEEMIAQSMKALMERDSGLAREVISRDREVDQLEMQIDDLCLQLLALRQPAASDLRFISIGLKISKDLERMGDLCVNISEQVIDLNKEKQLTPYVDLPKIAQSAKQMVKESLDAFVNRDTNQAQRICQSDDRVDKLCKNVFQELTTLMENDPTFVARGIRLLLISRYLERLADHATNIAEEVIFMVQGKDIRHGSATLER